MDEVHRVRTQHGADLVHLIADLDNTCGRAYKMTTVRSDFSTFAFGTTDYACHYQFSFAHELGHNMGLSHDRYAQKCTDSGVCNQTIDNRPYAYSYGYVNQRALGSGSSSSRRWRTIMAYRDQCTSRNIRCDRIRYFSTPNRSRGGDRLGIAGNGPSQSITGPSNAVRTLNETRVTVANFRQSRSDGNPDLEVLSPSVSDATLTPGQSFTFSVTVRNQGRGFSPSTTLVYFRRPAGGDWTQIGTDSVGSLSGAATSFQSITLTAPSIAGIYYYAACVYSVAGDNNSDNNCSSAVRVVVRNATCAVNPLGSVAAARRVGGSWGSDCVSSRQLGLPVPRMFGAGL